MSKGQSLIELLIASGVFAIVITGLAFLVFDSYVSGRLAEEMTRANFLAEEGLEAVRSVRDNSWDDLTPGDHGLAIYGGNWIFQGAEEDIAGQLNQGVRTIKIEEIDSDRKRVVSQITWQFTEARPQQIQLTTYLTNWQKVVVICEGTCAPCSGFRIPGLCRAQDGCSWDARNKICQGSCAPCENFSDQDSCEGQTGCSWSDS